MFAQFCPACTHPAYPNDFFLSCSCSDLACRSQFLRSRVFSNRFTVYRCCVCTGIGWVASPELPSPPGGFGDDMTMSQKCCDGLFR